MVKKRPSSAPLARIFVRIGALRRFHAMKKKTADLPVEVSWDRRRSDPRERSDTDGSTPQQDRRGKPPYTWEVADFVVVEDPLPEPKAPAKKR
jgi:hypothetical protein